jgi:small nuclear ribonucleoprotein
MEEEYTQRIINNLVLFMILSADSSPSTDLLSTSIGKIIIIKLRGGKGIKGKLLDFDQYMNLVVADSVEVLLKENNDDLDNTKNSLGTVLIRADNILIIALESSV